MKRKINFKKTWWILLLMFLLFLFFAITSASIDYALHNPDIFNGFMDEIFIGNFTNFDILVIIHTSYIVMLLVGLGLCVWLILWKLFDKFNKA